MKWFGAARARVRAIPTDPARLVRCTDPDQPDRDSARSRQTRRGVPDLGPESRREQAEVMPLDAASARRPAPAPAPAAGPPAGRIGRLRIRDLGKRFGEAAALRA